MTPGFNSEHPSVEQLDALVDYLMSRHDASRDDSVRAAREHCASCPACSAELGRLRAVRSRLIEFGAELVAIPAGLTDRVVTTLNMHSQQSTTHFPVAAAKAVTQSIPIIGGPRTAKESLNDDVRPMSQADIVPLGGRRTGPGKVPVYAAIAAIAVLGAVAVAAQMRWIPMNRTDQIAANLNSRTAAPQPPAQINVDKARHVMRSSGTNYTPELVRQQVATLLAAVNTTEPGAKTQGKVAAVNLPGPTNVPEQPGTLSDDNRFADCLRALNLDEDRLLAFDIAKWNSSTAAIAVSEVVGERSVWVVGDNCGEGQDDDLLYWGSYTE